MRNYYRIYTLVGKRKYFVSFYKLGNVSVLSREYAEEKAVRFSFNSVIKTIKDLSNTFKLAGKFHYEKI